MFNNGDVTNFKALLHLQSVSHRLFQMIYRIFEEQFCQIQLEMVLTICNKMKNYNHNLDL